MVRTGAQPPPSSQVVQFHQTHGSALTLSEGNVVVTRTQQFCNGIAFSAQSIKINQKLCLELTRTSEWSGAIRIGATSQNPGTMTVESLPRYVCPELTNRQGFWARALSESYADSGNRITFYVNTKGQMHYFVNNEHKGILLNNLPTNVDLWALFDIYGNTISAKFVPPDEAPVEILARGSDAMRAYHRACEQGTQPVFRTRLMLVGQERVGKTSLKRALTGQGHNTSEESTDGIDLSASCSFNLRERKAWKLAINGDSVPVNTSSRHTSPGRLDTLEDEYNHAVASNIVHELLHLHRKNDQRAKLEEERDGPEKSAIIAESDTNYKDKKRKDMSGSESGGSSDSLLEDMQSYEPLKEMPDKVVQLVGEMLKKWEARNQDATGESGPAPGEMENGRNIVLNIWDFAGQAAYYTTHQVFLSSRAVYIIVFNLCHEIKDLIKSPTNKSVTEADRNQTELSSFDYMDFWMNSIHVHTAQNTRNSVENLTLSPPIFIVGTHRNCLHPDSDICNQMVKEKMEAIQRALQGRPYQRHIITHFYAVENHLDTGEDEQVGRLRRHIEEVASREPYMGEQIPLKWLRFEQAIAQKVDDNCYFATVGQMREVAREAGIVLQEEFYTMVAFYHDLGVLVYYGKGGTHDNTLCNTVILKPQWLVDMFKRIITVRDVDHKWGMYRDLWQRLDTGGILEEKLIDFIWSDVISQKAALLGLMDKFDLICQRTSTNSTTKRPADHGRSYYVPSRMKRCPDVHQLYSSSDRYITFYFDFNGFLPDGLFHRVLTRCTRWTDETGGHEPQLFYRKGKFFLDSEHDFILEMAPIHLARIKICVLRVVDLDESDDSSSDEGEEKSMPPPKPAACAKVRNFVESTLSELKELWMKRISYRACVECCCDIMCAAHGKPRCQLDSCVHFLNLDECLSNKIVCCEHRRIKTAMYRKWFPASVPVARQGPVLPESVVKDAGDHMFGNIEATKGPELPGWVKSAAKLLNGGSEGQDWTALAKKLGYKKSLEKFADDLNPGLALITDWIINSGNTALSVDMMIACLEQMMRDDIVEIIQKARESEVAPPQVFISYQWDSQDEVNALRNKLEKSGFTCWMDIGQMGGGDQLNARVDEGIRNAKIVVACLTPKYVTSHHCNRELGLADLLRKPILPVMYERVPWPPPGGMALILSQLIYINMKGVGGHGGSGIHADLASKYQEVIQRASCFATPDPAAVEVTEDTENKTQILHSDSSSSDLGSPLPSVTNPRVIGGYGPTLTLSGQRHRSHHPHHHHPQHHQHQQQPGLGEESGQGGNTAETSAQSPRLVEEVHVTKCAVCNVL